MGKELDIIGGQVIELAEKIISEDSNDEVVKLMQRYNSYFAQFIQIVSSSDENEKGNSLVISNVEQVHKSLLDKLNSNKELVMDEIMRINQDLNIKNKYYGKISGRLGIDKKG